MELSENFPSNHQLFFVENCYTKPLGREDEFTMETVDLSSLSRASYQEFPQLDHHASYQDFNQLERLNLEGSSSNPFYVNNGLCLDSLDTGNGFGCHPRFDFYETKPYSNGSMLPPLMENNFSIIGAGINFDHSPMVNANATGNMVPPLRSRLVFPLNFREMDSSLKYRPPDEGSCTTTKNGAPHLLEGGGSAAVVTLAPKKSGKGRKKKSNVVKGQWTIEEDRLLVQLVGKYGVRKWSQIAQVLNGRIGKQCRERWHNHLRPDIKKDVWSEEEDRILIDAHIEIGNKWAEIAKRLLGRTENSIKNHWNATKRRQFSRRKCRSKYPRQSSLLQEYIKGLNIEKINAGCRKKTYSAPVNNNTMMLENTSMTAVSAPPTTIMVPIYDDPPPPAKPQTFNQYEVSEACSADRLVPEYDFSEVPEFNFDANMFEESSVESLMDEMNYGRHDPFGISYDMENNMAPFNDASLVSFEVKKELDLVEMINQVNL